MVLRFLVFKRSIAVGSYCLVAVGKLEVEKLVVNGLSAALGSH
jgi:hypothetical protein